MWQDPCLGGHWIKRPGSKRVKVVWLEGVGNEAIKSVLQWATKYVSWGSLHGNGCLTGRANSQSVVDRKATATNTEKPDLATADTGASASLSSLSPKAGALLTEERREACENQTTPPPKKVPWPRQSLFSFWGWEWAEKRTLILTGESSF